MDSIPHILERLDMQHICSFLLTGQKRCYRHRADYQAEIDAVCKEFLEMIDNQFTDLSENDAASNLFAKLAVTLEHIYFEVGFRCGAKLILELSGSWPKVKAD